MSAAGQREYLEWGNPRWHRLLMWALRIPSPSLLYFRRGGLTTFLEAWTGRVHL